MFSNGVNSCNWVNKIVFLPQPYAWLIMVNVSESCDRRNVLFVLFKVVIPFFSLQKSSGCQSQSRHANAVCKPPISIIVFKNLLYYVNLLFKVFLSNPLLSVIMWRSYRAQTRALSTFSFGRGCRCTPVCSSFAVWTNRRHCTVLPIRGL